MNSVREILREMSAQNKMKQKPMFQTTALKSSFLLFCLIYQTSEYSEISQHKYDTEDQP